MQQFGSANNFSGQIGERALKSMVKDMHSKPNDELMFLQVNVLTENMSQLCTPMLTMILNIFWAAQRQKMQQMMTEKVHCIVDITL